MSELTRFRFASFVLSPRHRVLLYKGAPVALIPKYFDLLLLLVIRRGEAVSKQTIFSEVWNGVIVSDGALAQAVRTLRRTLGDGSREPRFIRTVSRYGYQFVWTDVIEEIDEGQVAAGCFPATPVEPSESVGPLVNRLLAAAKTGAPAEDEACDIAERLHELSTEAAMSRLVAQPNHAPAVAIMRDARWNVPGSGRVPLLSDPEAVSAILALIRLRLSDVGRAVARRWVSAAVTGSFGGAAAGICGGAALYLSPISEARPQVILALAASGALAGGIGAAGVGAGLVVAEALARSRRTLALTACGAAAGWVVAMIAHIVLRAVLEGLFGLRIPHIAGGIDGLVLGAAAGAGYGLGTPQPPGGGLAAPTGRKRLAAIAFGGACCAAGATILALFGRPLVGGLVHDIAAASRDADLVLGPLGHLIGEPGFGPVARAILSTFEGGAFGCALFWGLTDRPRPLAE